MDGLSVELLSDSPEHTAGQLLRGTVHVPAQLQHQGLSITATLRWFTEGKGEPESGEYAHRIPVQGPAAPATIPFEIPLPEQPWSYDGRIIKIRWALRVALDLRQQGAATELELELRSPFLDKTQGPYRT